MKNYEKYMNKIVETIYEQGTLKKELEYNSLTDFKKVLIKEAKNERVVIDYFQFSMDNLFLLPNWFHNKFGIIGTWYSSLCIYPKDFKDYRYGLVQGDLLTISDRDFIREGCYIVLYDDFEVEIESEKPEIGMEKYRGEVAK